MDRQEMMKRIMEKRRKARPEMPEDDSHDRDYSLDDDFLSEDMEPDMDVMSEDREEHEKLSHRDRVAKIMRDRRGY